MPFVQFQFRRGTAAEWTSANPTLAAGEFGVETDTELFKIGDGSTAWNALGYGGLQGIQGETGAQGDPGADGESAYDVAVANGFVGDEAAWLASLVGAAGADGADGAAGADGNDGTDGRTILSGSGAPSGGTGENGDFYLDLSAGDLYGPKTAGDWGTPISLIGPQGEAGANGSNGANGSDGADGNSVLSGSGAPDGGTGNDGDFYIDTAAWDIYGPKASGVWGSGTSLIGPQGDPGEGGGGGIPWSIVNSDTTMAAGNAYHVDASAANKTMTLPATLTAADELIVHCYTAGDATKKVIIAPNGHSIRGPFGTVTSSDTLELTDGQTARLVARTSSAMELV